MAEREPFCCNEQCEFHEPKMRRNEGDRLRLSDGSEVLRHYIGSRFFCACCARAVELAIGVVVMANGSSLTLAGPAEKLVSGMPVDLGEAGCSHCYDGGCGDPLGCGETDRRNAGVRVDSMPGIPLSQIAPAITPPGAKVYCCYGMYADMGHDANCPNAPGVPDTFNDQPNGGQ